MKVSVFKQCKYYDSDTSTQMVIETIRSGSTKAQVNALRQLLNNGKIKEYDKLKKSYPASQSQVFSAMEEKLKIYMSIMEI